MIKEWSNIFMSIVLRIFSLGFCFILSIVMIGYYNSFGNHPELLIENTICMLVVNFIFIPPFMFFLFGIPFKIVVNERSFTVVGFFKSEKSYISTKIYLISKFGVRFIIITKKSMFPLVLPLSDNEEKELLFYNSFKKMLADSK